MNNIAAPHCHVHCSHTKSSRQVQSILAEEATQKSLLPSIWYWSQSHQGTAAERRKSFLLLNLGGDNLSSALAPQDWGLWVGVRILFCFVFKPLNESEFLKEGRCYQEQKKKAYTMLRSGNICELWIHSTFKNLFPGESSLWAWIITKGAGAQKLVGLKWNGRSSVGKQGLDSVLDLPLSGQAVEMPLAWFTLLLQG